MARCIVVLGTGRSGTSVVAGMCHRMGAHMGDRFMPADSNNPSGTYEEMVLFKMNRQPEPATVEQYQDYARFRDTEGYPIWGIKDPALVSENILLPLISQLQDVRIVVTHRAEVASIQSYCKAYNADWLTGSEWCATHNLMLRQVLEKVKHLPRIDIQFDDIYSDTAGVADKLAKFLFDGLPVEAGPLAIANGIEHVSHRLRNFDNGGKWIERPRDEEHEGWGNIAVGCRIHRHPETAFFVDWTGLVSSGMRTGDTVLLPRGAMPAHWAGNALVRDFLRTDKDTLLLIDDDMSFSHLALEEMRTNEANWEYDICFAFCTMRVWPPKPILMRRGMQPPPPQHLQGEWYHRVMDFVPGTVLEVDAVGLAFTLIRRGVLEAMIDSNWGPTWTEWFQSMTRKGLFRETVGDNRDDDMSLAYTSWMEYGEGKESEDIPFSRKARELGFRLCVDTSVQIGHIGYMPLGYHQFVKWRDTELAGLTEVHMGAAEMIPSLEEALKHVNGQHADNIRKLLESLQ